MNRQFRAIAVDFDGTLTASAEPSGAVLTAIEETRRQGLRVLLVTGRILTELREVFPSVDERFDAVVAENGAVFSVARSARVLSTPVEFELDKALERRAVPFRRGQILLATHASYEEEIQEEIRRLGLECQLVRNRAELMILPAGISKGVGISQALGTFGISPHNAIGLGDAENDHSLLSVCEIGVAVANAVPGLKRHADLVLEKPNGEGVAALLRQSLLERVVPLRPQRWRIDLGRLASGDRATIPASQINVLITGRSKAGKSFVAGALAERMIELGYSVCLIDPEGDYGSLGGVHGVDHLGKPGKPPDIEQIRSVMTQHFGSVIVDLSMLDTGDHASYIQGLLRELADEREATGLPHWIIIDEAHNPLGLPGELLTALAEGQKGYCLVTYQPQVLAENLRTIDVLIALPGGRGPDGPDPVVEIDRLCGLGLSDLLAEAGTGQAAMVRLGEEDAGSLVMLAPRRTEHVRHWHKYLRAKLRPEKRFVFRRSGDEDGAVAANVEEFHHLLRSSAAEILAAHAAQGDFSRWIEEALQDSVLAGTIGRFERSFVASDRTAADLEALREGLVTAIGRRYVE